MRGRARRTTPATRGGDMDAGRGSDVPADEAPLTPENAEVLLDELEGTLGGLEGGDGPPPPELVTETRRLLDGLDRLPGPDGAVEDRVEKIRAWTEVLLSDLPPQRHPGPGSPADVVEELLYEVRALVHEERTGLGT